MRTQETFEKLLEQYRKPDGSKWTGAEIEEATGGTINRSYITNLRKGRIRQPGLERLRAIASIMGFPVELWFETAPERGISLQTDNGSGQSTFAARLDRLFEVTLNERTHRPFTNAEVARLSLGKLTEEQVESMRSGELEDPTLRQLLALSEVFEVDHSYWFADDRRQPLLDREALEALRDEDNQKILHKSLRLSERDRGMLLTLAEEMGLADRKPQPDAE